MSEWMPQQYSKVHHRTGGPAPAIKGRGKAFRWLSEHVAWSGDACLPWPFAKDNRVGRGTLGYNGRRFWAHRLMCEMAHGAPPTPKHQAAHNCGKGHYGCVNPRHLEWKNNSQNQLDRAKNGNALRNRGGPKSALTDVQKSEIVLLRGKEPQTTTAARLGVSLGCVQYWQKYRKERGHDRRQKYAWLPDEEAKLRNALSTGASLKAFAAEIERSEVAVLRKIGRMGLSVSLVRCQ